MRVTQTQVMHWIFVECLNAQRATKRDHPVARFHVTDSATFIDGFAADDAEVVPIGYVRIFEFAHEILVTLRLFAVSRRDIFAALAACLAQMLSSSPQLARLAILCAGFAYSAYQPLGNMRHILPDRFSVGQDQVSDCQGMASLIFDRVVYCITGENDFKKELSGSRQGRSRPG